MLSVAKGMRALDLSFDLILSSPFIRAKETAEIVARIFKIKKELKLTFNLAVGGDPEELINELKRDFDSLESVLLVGHEPYLSHFISFLLTGTSGLSLEMKKAGFCKLKIDILRYGRCATLEWLLTPAQLTRLR
jgi:phosphohistidine phosphatase